MSVTTVALRQRNCQQAVCAIAIERRIDLADQHRGAPEGHSVQTLSGLLSPQSCIGTFGWLALMS